MYSKFIAVRVLMDGINMINSGTRPTRRSDWFSTNSPVGFSSFGYNGFSTVRPRAAHLQIVIKFAIFLHDGQLFFRREPQESKSLIATKNIFSKTKLINVACPPRVWIFRNLLFFSTGFRASYFSMSIVAGAEQVFSQSYASL